MTFITLLLKIHLRVWNWLDGQINFNKLGRLWRFLYWKRKLKQIGENVVFFKGVIINDPYNVIIGNNTGVGNYVVMWGAGGIEIGNDVLIAAHSVLTADGHDTNAELFRKSSYLKKIKIGNNVWIGANVCVLPGVEIGDNCIIAAGSVVTKSILHNSIAAGVPAVVLKKRTSTDV